MKNLLIIILLGISTTASSQNSLRNSSTWLYSFKESATFSNEWSLPHIYKSNLVRIYYDNDGYWEFVETIVVLNPGVIYFKDGYRVAYGFQDEKPGEIILKPKEKWKVE